MPARVLPPVPSPPEPIRVVDRVAWRDGAATEGVRGIPEEVPVAFTYGRTTQAVMLASPADLEDFAVGFSLCEGIIAAPGEIEALDVVTTQEGIELRMDLAEPRLAALTRRQRRMAGPTGCGLCGLDSLAAALRPVPPVAAEALRLAPAAIQAAMAALPAAQPLNQASRAVHAAGFWVPGRGLGPVREDVGRHNALDKLAGALARVGQPAEAGVVLLSSRVSVEMVQKAAMIGAPVIVAVSAPTALAVRLAAEAGITLIGIARPDGFEVFTCPQRILLASVQHVA